MISLNLPPRVVASFTDQTLEIGRYNPDGPKGGEAFELSRLLDFINGRYCAYQCLSRMHRLEPIRKDASGAPIWPKEVTGSISHSNGLAGALVAQKSDYKAVGLDIERIGRIDTTLWPVLFTEKEITFLKKRSSASQSQLSTVFFSLKEAYYKMQYPLTQRGMEPLEVEIDLSQNDPVVKEKVPTPSPLVHVVLQVNYEVKGNDVISYVLAE